MLEDLDLHSIVDEQARALVRQLLNLLEDVSADLRAAQAEIQRLRNEINRLKGEPSSKSSRPGEVHPQARTDPDGQEGRPPARGRSGSCAHDLPQHHACVRRSHVARQ